MADQADQKEDHQKEEDQVGHKKQADRIVVEVGHPKAKRSTNLGHVLPCADIWRSDEHTMVVDCKGPSYGIVEGSDLANLRTCQCHILGRKEQVLVLGEEAQVDNHILQRCLVSSHAKDRHVCKRLALRYLAPVSCSIQVDPFYIHFSPGY